MNSLSYHVRHLLEAFEVEGSWLDWLPKAWLLRLGRPVSIDARQSATSWSNLLARSSSSSVSEQLLQEQD